MYQVKFNLTEKEAELLMVLASGKELIETEVDYSAKESLAEKGFIEIYEQVGRVSITPAGSFIITLI